jgi:peroxin-12
MLEKHKRLTRRQVLGSLFFVIVEPYIREKLDTRYEILKGRYAFRSIDSDRDEVYSTGSTSAKLQYEFDRLLLRVYPTVTFVRSGITLGFYLLFLFSRSTRSSLAEALLNIRYSRLNDFDYKRHETGAAEKGFSELMLMGQPLTAAKNVALSTLSYTLPTSMFLLKFLEWWYSSDFARQMSRKTRGLDESFDVPKPPVRSLSSSGMCPLCQSDMENPTVIETGVVFCYTCIYRHLRDAPEKTGGRCPVSGQRLLQCAYNEELSEWDVGGLRRLMI